MRKPYPDLHEYMTRKDIADVLDRLIFNASKNWRGSIWIDKPVRDLIVKALRTEK